MPLEQTFSPSLERALGALDPLAPLRGREPRRTGLQQRAGDASLEESGLAYHPDLVIVNFVLNDAGRMVQLIPHDSNLPVGLRRLLKRSDLVQFVYGSVKQIRFLARGGAFREGDKYSDLAPGNTDWQAARTALAEIARLAVLGGRRNSQSLSGRCSSTSARTTRTAPARVRRHRMQAARSHARSAPALGHGASALWGAKDDHHPNAIALGMGAVAVAQDLTARYGLPAATGERSR